MGEARAKNLANLAEIQEQSLRYSPDERALIRSTFDDETLMSFRKFILQGKLSEAEMANVKDLVKKPEAITLLRKALIPEIDPSIDVQNIDHLNDVYAIELNNLLIDYAYWDMQARALSSEYLKQRFDEAEGKKTEKFIKLADFKFNPAKDKERAYIDLKARNDYIIKHLEFQIKQLRYFHALEEETPSQQAERLLKNSSK